MKQKTQRIAIYLVILTTLLTALGQIFFKYASKTFELNLYALITNHFLILGLFFYGIASITLIMGLRKGEISTLYPIIALSYVWVLLASFFLFKEQIVTLQIIGIIMIILGVSVMGVANSE